MTAIDLTRPQLLTSGIRLSAVDPYSNDGIRSLSPYWRTVNCIDQFTTTHEAKDPESLVVDLQEFASPF